jgi:AcrR family transcriptional regulator
MTLGTDALQAPLPGAPADIPASAMMRKGPDRSTATLRYAKKREAVIAAATHILNQRGVKGMTLADVATSVGLITTSVTYYFKKKEDLAAACFLSGISRYDALIGEALHEPTPQARLHRFLTLYLELKARIRMEGEAAMPAFNDVRALTEPRLTQVRSAYADVFRRVRGLFDAEGFEWMQKRMSTARTHMIMEQLFWAVAWLSRYEVEDYPRIRDRMFDIFAHGVSVEGAQWLPDRLEVNDRSFADAQAAAPDQFLVAATRLINREGYRGASVEKISAELNVTKGSFYHHNVGKDDLVVECFERTFRLMRATQSAAMRADGDQWTRLTTVASALVEYQLSDRGPLLRSSAFSALPETMRGRMIEQSNRVSDRFSAMISDGVAEGSVRPVDPVIAAQMLNATLNASQELRFVVRGVKPHQGADLYARPMLMGVFTP